MSDIKVNEAKEYEITVLKRPKLTPLAQLPDKIKKEHDGINESARKMLEHILKCGDFLIQAREQTRGNFKRWLELNCDWLHWAQAHRYMKVAEMYPRLSESHKKRAAELKSFRQIWTAITGAEINRKQLPAPKETKHRRDRFARTECRYRGCVRPAEAILYCGEHVSHGIKELLDMASREDLRSIRDYVDTLMEDSEDPPDSQTPFGNPEAEK